MSGPTFWDLLLEAVYKLQQESGPQNGEVRIRPQGWPANPFSAGIREGSGAHRALLALEAAAPEALTTGEILIVTGVSRDALKRGLAELVRRELVATRPDPRNSHWRTYQLAKQTALRATGGNEIARPDSVQSGEEESAVLGCCQSHGTIEQTDSCCADGPCSGGSLADCDDDSSPVRTTAESFGCCPLPAADGVRHGGTSFLAVGGAA